MTGEASGYLYPQLVLCFFPSFLFLWTLGNMVGDIFGIWKAVTQLLKTAVVFKFGLPLTEEFWVFWAMGIFWYMKIYIMYLKAKKRQCLDKPHFWMIYNFLPSISIGIIICTLGDESAESWESHNVSKSQMGK